MRFCIYNPHTIIGKTVFSYLFRTSHNRNNDFFLDLIKNKKYKTALIVDGTASSLTSGSVLIKFVSDNYALLRIISFFEIYLWCWINKVNPLHIPIIFKANNLRKDDLVFGFGFLTDTFLNDQVASHSLLSSFRGQKIFQATHYFGRTHQIARNIKKNKIQYFLSESDLTRNSYFSRYFDFIKKVYVLPFVLRDRYHSLVPFEKRINKCFATGTLLLLSDNPKVINQDNADYINYFKTPALHPMRLEIYKHRKNLKKVIDSYIFPQINERHSLKHRSYHDWIVYKIWIKLTSTDQKKYHSFDIVDKYNQYRMFVCPEENIGIPSVNFIEGMACGCAYIGLDSHMYTDLGLVDGENYIAYDGTLTDLVNKIKYYQNHRLKLKKIAANGREFVVNSFKKETVTDKFMADMDQFVRTSILKSSFLVTNK